MEIDNQKIQPIINDFLGVTYSPRFSQYWVRRFGLIPELPTSYDNSNDIYDLLAWLQRGFKMLLDDFLNLELEFEQFKNALIEMLEILIPKLIREYVKSDEFKKLIYNIIDEWYKEKLEPIINQIQNDIKKIQQDIKQIQNDITQLQNDITNLTKRVEALEKDNAILKKIIQNLINSGAMDSEGNFGNNKIAYGTINVFGGAADGSYYVRTNSGKTENDLLGGV